MKCSSTKDSSASSRYSPISAIVLATRSRVMLNHSVLVADRCQSSRPSRIDLSGMSSKIFGINHLKHDHPSKKAGQMQFSQDYPNAQTVLEAT